jgi:hypothetical protein
MRRAPSGVPLSRLLRSPSHLAQSTGSGWIARSARDGKTNRQKCTYRQAGHCHCHRHACRSAGRLASCAERAIHLPFARRSRTISRTLPSIFQ